MSPSQTCGHFRQILREAKAALINSINPDIIALPLGESLSTIGTEDLFARAVRAATLSNRLSHSGSDGTLNPRKCRKIVLQHDIPADHPIRAFPKFLIASPFLFDRYAIFRIFNNLHFSTYLIGFILHRKHTFTSRISRTRFLRVLNLSTPPFSPEALLEMVTYMLMSTP